MITFIMFGKYSQLSVKEISANRTHKATAVVEENGGKIISGYALLGKTDLIIVAEFPSVEAAMKTSVALTKLLGISFTTSPALSVEEFDKLIG